MSSPSNAAEKLGKFVGLALSAFLITCLRAWLLSMCAAIFFPTFVLSFWQWCLLSFTFRLMTAPERVSDD